MITHIFHISDIHIFEKNYVNLKNAWRHLISAIISWPSYKQNILLVITGDIFEFKTYLNSDDVHIFYTMMTLLELYQIRTLIIPGNHDYNINTQFAQDNVSILLGGPTTTPNISYVFDDQNPGVDMTRWQYIKCFPKTGTYCIDNVCFWVYSPIDKKIPEAINDDISRINIALLHEPIISAQYDNNETIFKGRFHINDLINHDIVMLGDIHRPQFLASNVAYAGSFVQKNRGEGINHGYILWDLATKTGQHIWIPLKEVCLKFMAKNNVIQPLIDIPEETQITYMYFVHQGCSPDWITETAETIMKKYNRRIDQIVRQDLFEDLSQNLQVAASNSKVHISHSDLIRQILGRSSTNEHMIQKVLDYHNTFLQNRRPLASTRYVVKYLSWSNVFCYGSDNYINFDEIKGLVALSGRNKTGKSSVIDIIIRILFNECERGHKDDVLNKNAKTGFIKCCFTIGSDTTVNTYIIEQKWQKYSSSSTHNLYCNGENITKDSLIKTYKYMRDELGLGNYKDFVNLTTAIQNRQFIVDLDKKDMYSLLCKLLEIDTLKDIEEHVKKERDFLKRSKKNLLKEMEVIGNDNYSNEIVIIQNNLDNKYTTRLQLENALTEINKELRDLNRKIQLTDLPNDWLPTLDTQIESLPWSESEHNINLSKLNNLTIEYEVQKRRLKTLEKNKVNEIRNALASGDLTQKSIQKLLNSNINALKKEASQTLFIVPKFKTNYTYNKLLELNQTEYGQLSKTEYDKNLDNLYRQLIPCEISEIVNVNEPEGDSLSVLQNRNDEYQDAQKNYLLYKTKYEVAKEFMDILKKHSAPDTLKLAKKLYVIHKEMYYKAKELINQDNTKILKKISEWQTFINTIKNNDLIIHNINIDNKIKQCKLRQDIADDIETYKLIMINDAIEQAQKKMKLYDAALVYREYYDLKHSMHNIQEQITRYQLLISQWIAANTQMEHKNNYDSNLSKYNIELKNKQYIDDIQKLTMREQQITEELKILDDEIAKLDRLLLDTCAIQKQYNGIIKKIADIDDTLNLYDAYYNCINYKTGIPSAILRQTCVILSEQCNKILSNITDFLVEFIFEDEIKIYTVHKGSVPEVKISASLGSGFQKFIIDMVMRIVLTKISNISNPNIIFIDEGFGCLDRENFIAVCNCLNKIKNNFDAMIIITHISELQSYMDMNMTISMEQNRSKLQFGKLKIADYDLHENENYRNIKASLDKSDKIEITNKNIMPIQEKNVVSSQSILIDKDIHTSTNEQILFPCDKSRAQLCELLNVSETDLTNKIIEKLIDVKSDIYNCIPCKKTFKKMQLARSHVGTKTYKNKHLKYLFALHKN